MKPSAKYLYQDVYENCFELPPDKMDNHAINFLYLIGYNALK